MFVYLWKNADQFAAFCIEALNRLTVGEQLSFQYDWKNVNEHHIMKHDISSAKHIYLIEIDSLMD